METAAMLATIAVYLAAMLGIGVWCSRRNQTADDF